MVENKAWNEYNIGDKQRALEERRDLVTRKVDLLEELAVINARLAILHMDINNMLVEREIR